MHEPRTRRIVFSIVFSQWWSQALLVFKFTKSRRNFYTQIERRSFYAAKTQLGHEPSRCLHKSISSADQSTTSERPRGMLCWRHFVSVAFEPSSRTYLTTSNHLGSPVIDKGGQP